MTVIIAIITDDPSLSLHGVKSLKLRAVRGVELSRAPKTLSRAVMSSS